MKNKLIHTNLLSKHKHNSLLALATATHLEYCNYQYKRVMQENNYFYTLRNVLDELLFLIIFPIYALTHGFILYPVYVFSHISKQKKIIQRYDNDINGAVISNNLVHQEVISLLKKNLKGDKNELF